MSQYPERIQQRILFFTRNLDMYLDEIRRGVLENQVHALSARIVDGQEIEDLNFFFSDIFLEESIKQEFILAKKANRKKEI